MAQIFVFTGENAYLLRNEKLRWIGEFSRKFGPENLSRLSATGLELSALLDEISVAPFISARRLVVIEGIPRLSKEQMEVVEREVHPQVVVLFVEPKPDKRLNGVKQLLSIAEVKTFPPLIGKALGAWMTAYTASMGAALQSSAGALLLEYLGEDQDLLSEELRKLALSASAGSITRSDIERMSVPSFEGIVWRLTDLLCAGRRSEAMIYAHQYLERGGDAYGLWAILLNMLRNVIGVSAGISASWDAKRIAEELGLNPFAVRSMLPYARRVRPDQLRVFLAEAVEADIALKTGVYRATDEAPEELLALIDRFFLKVPVS